MYVPPKLIKRVLKKTSACENNSDGCRLCLEDKIEILSLSNDTRRLDKKLEFMRYHHSKNTYCVTCHLTNVSSPFFFSSPHTYYCSLLDLFTTFFFLFFFSCEDWCNGFFQFSQWCNSLGRVTVIARFLISLAF